MVDNGAQTVHVVPFKLLLLVLVMDELISDVIEDDEAAILGLN